MQDSRGMSRGSAFTGALRSVGHDNHPLMIRATDCERTRPAVPDRFSRSWTRRGRSSAVRHDSRISPSNRNPVKPITEQQITMAPRGQTRSSPTQAPGPRHAFSGLTSTSPIPTMTDAPLAITCTLRSRTGADEAVYEAYLPHEEAWSQNPPTFVVKTQRWNTRVRRSLAGCTGCGNPTVVWGDAYTRRSARPGGRAALLTIIDAARNFSRISALRPKWACAAKIFSWHRYHHSLTDQPTG